MKKIIYKSSGYLNKQVGGAKPTTKSLNIKSGDTNKEVGGDGVIKAEFCSYKNRVDVTDIFRTITSPTVVSIQKFPDIDQGNVKYLEIFHKDSSHRIIESSTYPTPNKNDVIKILHEANISEKTIYDFVENARDIQIYRDHIAISLIDFTSNNCLICTSPYKGAGVYCYVNYYIKTRNLFSKLGLNIKLCFFDSLLLYKNTPNDNAYLNVFSENENVIINNDHDVMRRYFSPSENVANKIKLLNGTYKIDCSNCVGVMYRGTDKVTECALPSVSSFIEAVTQLLKNNTESTILLQTDEESVVNMFKNTFGPKCITFNEIPRSNSGQNVFHAENMADRMETLAFFDAAIRIISQCSHVIANKFTSVNSALKLYRGNTNNFYEIS